MGFGEIATGAVAGGALGGPIGAVIGGAAGALTGIHGPRHHSSITFTDLNGNIQHAETEAQKQAFLKMQQDRQFKSDLKTYRDSSQQFQDRAKADNRATNEYIGATQAGAVAASAEQAGQRRGLGDEYTAALGANANTQLRTAITQGNMSFDQAVTALAQQDELGFVKHEIGFFQGLQTLQKQSDLSKSLVEFQAHLQQDMDSRQLLLDTLGIGAEIFGMRSGGGSGGGVEQGTPGRAPGW